MVELVARLWARFCSWLFIGRENIHQAPFFRTSKSQEYLLWILASLTSRAWRKTTINFLITSRAEIRVFEPLIWHLVDLKNVDVNIVFLRPFKFSSLISKQLEQSTNVRTHNGVWPVIRSCYQTQKSVNVICLDHARQAFHHRLGIAVSKAINRHGGTTICLQHGSTHKENIEGHKTSQSQYQIVWGNYLYRELLASGSSTATKIFVSGNPLHDQILNRDAIQIRCRLQNLVEKSGGDLGERRIVLLATCLHTEYDDREDPVALYRLYARKVYESLDFESCFLVIKMHPSDSESPNYYLEELPVNLKTSVLLMTPDIEGFSIYDLAIVADLVITRASTVAEESLVLGTQCVAFDLFADGPSTGLKWLEGVRGYRQCIDGRSDLKSVIKAMLSRDDEMFLPSEQFISNITFKLDGASARRVCDLLVRIADCEAGVGTNTNESL